MEALVVGAGVIGTVYASQLAKSGHVVDVLAHGTRTEQIDRTGLRVTDVASGCGDVVAVEVVPDGLARCYDLVLVSVRADQVGSAGERLQDLLGSPDVLLFGNHLAGRGGLRSALGGRVHLGFPGIGGSLNGDTVEFMHIPQQPTTLEAGGGDRIEELAATLDGSGFAVTRTSDLDGWLAHHGLFVACVAAALYRGDGTAPGLARDHAELRLMCRSIEEGFRALARHGVNGAPRNLRALHRPVLRIFAERYWARTMRSPMGERCFAAHARRAQPEMRLLAADALERIDGASRTEHLRQLLAAPGW